MNEFVTILKSMATTAPSAVAVIATVILFLRAMKDRDALLRDLHKEHEESRQASRKVIEENSRVMGQHLELGREVSEVLKEVSQNLQMCQYVREQLKAKE